VVDHLSYSAVDEAYGVHIFTEEKLPTDSESAVKTNRHIFDYVFADSKNEREFVALLDSGTEIEV
jgi:type III restriction enzyme